MVHSKIWYSNQVSQLKPGEQLLYIGMITLGDDEGRLRGEARYLRAHIFPYGGVSDARVEKMRDKIVEVGLIAIYSDKDGTYIRHPNWEKYQTLRQDKLKVSQLPPPPDTTRPSADGQAAAEVKRSEEKIMEEKLSETMAGVNARSAMLAGMPNNGDGTMFARKHYQPEQG